MIKKTITLYLFINLLACTNFDLDGRWINILKNKKLSDFIIKFNGNALNTNYKNTFILENNVLSTNYSEYDKFELKLGYLFYPLEQEFFHLTFEYHFYGRTLEGTPDWAYKNSGIMYYAQDPTTMYPDQTVPNSIEFIILGAPSGVTRHTGSLCVPGTRVEVEGDLITDCIDSSSDTYESDQWVKGEIIVRENSIHHIINGKVVLTLSKPVLDTHRPYYNRPNSVDGKKLDRGYIAFQVEGYNIKFRNVLLKKLYR